MHEGAGLLLRCFSCWLSIMNACTNSDWILLQTELPKALQRDGALLVSGNAAAAGWQDNRAFKKKEWLSLRSC